MRPVDRSSLLAAIDRDRQLRQAGIIEVRRRPYPGQRYKHGWIPVSLAAVLDDLDVELVDADQIQPLHDVTDDAKLGRLADSMREGGWSGPPVVVIPGRDYGWGPGNSLAITGSHRIAAAKDAGVEVPTIDLNDLLAKYGLTLADLDEMYGTDPDDETHMDSVRRLDEHLPKEIVEYLGLDAH